MSPSRPPSPAPVRRVRPPRFAVERADGGYRVLGVWPRLWDAWDTVAVATVADKATARSLAGLLNEHALVSERTMDDLEAARARGRTGGQKPKLGPRQAQLARQMYDEVDENGKQKWIVQQIAGEFGVTRPTIYRHLSKVPRQPADPT